MTTEEDARRAGLGRRWREAERGTAQGDASGLVRWLLRWLLRGLLRLAMGRDAPARHPLLGSLAPASQGLVSRDTERDLPASRAGCTKRRARGPPPPAVPVPLLPFP